MALRAHDEPADDITSWPPRTPPYAVDVSRALAAAMIAARWRVSDRQRAVDDAWPHVQTEPSGPLRANELASAIRPKPDSARGG